VTTRSLPQTKIPANIWDAEVALRKFDFSTKWGPRLSLTRSERLVRGRKLGVQDDWEWIDDILRRFPALGGLKAHEQYQEHVRDSEAQSSMLDLNTRHALTKRQTHTPRLTAAGMAMTEELASTVLADPTSRSEHSRPDE
jgi:hypothetical protein